MSKPRKRHNICAGRPYGSDGKKQWIRVGELTEWDDGGFSIRLDSVPAGNWFDGTLKCFDADEERGKGGQQQARVPASGERRERPAPPAQQPSNDFADDDIPF